MSKTARLWLPRNFNPERKQHSMSASDQKKLGRKVAWGLVFVGIVACIVAFSGVSSREKSETRLTKWTIAQAIQTVDVISPKLGLGPQELVLPGDIEAWYSAPIHARVSGYVKMWYKDIGAKVKAGDVLADIDTPELDQQVEQAKGELAKAQANASLAELTAKRWETLRQSAAVSQQVTDEKDGDYKARLADVSSAKANVARLEAFESFKQLTAPFDGVITERKIDVGALVHGTESTATELFDVADVHEMRIYVDVPQAFAAQLHPGMKAKLVLPQYPSRTFNAVLATTSDAISKKARTLLVELHRDNKDGLLQSGSFVEVHFELSPDPNVMVLPASAFIFRSEKQQVAVVGVDNRVVLRTIEIGRDLGTEIEILSGLSPTDRIIRNPSDSVGNGDIVHIKGEASASEASAR
jgi:RND family efflux transporter MFP subunit